MEHLQGMAVTSDSSPIHALDLEALRKPEITFWSAWEGDELVGCGALQELDAQQGEVKAMRTSSLHFRKGVATQILQYIIDEAMRRGYRQLYLETGSTGYDAARRLYERFGFQYCEWYSDSMVDPNSVFMTLQL